MNHGSLFSGIGGFDLAARWMGWENVFHVERDPFCRQVLTHHFPKSKSYDDIKAFDATPFRGRVQIISGGFPCQPFSAAGKRGGTSDDRYLWPEMFRVVREVRPTWVVAENVRGLLSWNDGMVLDTVCTDLEGEGYEVFPTVLPAAGVNAPHRRDRIWIIAHRHDRLSQHPHQEVQSRGNAADVGGSDAPDTEGGGVCRDAGELCETQRRQNNELHAEPVEHGTTRSADAPNPNGEERQRRCSASQREREEAEQGRHGVQCAVTRPCEESDATNADSNVRSQGRMHTTRPEETAGHVSPCDARPVTWEDFPSVPPICGGDDGLPTELDGITFPKWRRESIKAYGNAIVPQVALQIFKAIQSQ